MLTFSQIQRYSFLMSMVALVILAVAVSGMAIEQVEKISTSPADAAIKENNEFSTIAEPENPKHNGAAETAELVGAGAAGLVGGLLVGAALSAENGYGYYPGSYVGPPYYPNQAQYPYFPNPGYLPSVGYLPQRPQGPYYPGYPGYGDMVLTYPGYYSELLHGNMASQTTTSLPANSQERNAANGQQDISPFYYLGHQTGQEIVTEILSHPEEDETYYSGNYPLMYQDDFQL